MRWVHSTAAGFAAAILSVLALSRSALAAPDCHLRELAALPITMTPDGRPIVPIRIDGHDENMLVATGEDYSALRSRTIHKLGLVTRYMGSAAPYADGTSMIAVSHTAELGRAVAENASFRELRGESLGPDVAGIVGLDMLSHVDVEFDFAGGTLNLFSSDHCPGQVVYWTHSPSARVKIGERPGKMLSVPVTLDGTQLTAALDTGEASSSMDMHDARYYFGWQSDPPELTPVSVPASNHDHLEYRYPFKLLTFEGVAVRNPAVTITLAPLYWPSSRSPQVSLGMNVLRALHIYVAWKEGYLYATAADAR